MLILVGPFVGFLITSLFGRHLGYVGAALVTSLGILISWISSLILFFFESTINNTQYVYAGNWLDFYLFSVKWCFLFDSLTVIMLLTVTTVSLIVHIYSYDYMYADPHLPRFMSYLSLFTTFMLVLLTANNFIQLFLGWEGVGLCSYLLINFWFTRIPANKAAIKAIMYNRVGDIGLLLGVAGLFYLTKTLDFSTIFLLVPYLWEKNIIVLVWSVKVLNMIGFFLFIGAVGKSAQLGLHTWLPSAMEGPTPVSALIHAATMVTAGVFLVIRCSFIFEYIPLVLNIILCLGGLTAFFAATAALVQNDIKKIVAYSTCSQLGYMVLTCGLSNYSLSLFHLVNHAFFKALLFLTCGLIIHALFDEQDIRKMGGLILRLPAAYIFMLTASLALIGFPFCAGYYSKDLILELLYVQQNTINNFIYYLGAFTAFLTSFYSTRLLFFVFFGAPNGFKRVSLNMHFNSIFVVVVLSFLLAGSVLSGFFLKDLFISAGSNFFSLSIFTKNNLVGVDYEFMPFSIKLLPTVLSTITLFSFLYVYHLPCFYSVLLQLQYRFLSLHNFFLNSWYFDKFFNFVTYHVFYYSYKYIFRITDKGLLEIFGPFGITSYLKFTSKETVKFHDGYIYNYIIIFAFSIVVFLSIFL